MINKTLTLAGTTVVLAFACLQPVHAAVDAVAAKALFKDHECTKCHDAVKAKKGPSLKKIAQKYKGNADGQSKLVTNFTTEPMVKFADGKQEKHKAIDSKDPVVLKNLADWILAR